MNFYDVKKIYAIIEEMNITRAAKKLYISQPALSQIVKKVEQEFQIKLFERASGSRLKLTQEGKFFLEFAEQVVPAYDTFLAKAAEEKKDRKNEIWIGIPVRHSIEYSPLIIREYKKKFPEDIVHIIERPSNELENLLETGKLNMAFMRLPVMDPSLCKNIILSERFMLYLGRDSALLGHWRSGAKISVPDLKDEPMILPPSGTKKRKLIEAIYEKYKIIPKVVNETAGSLISVQQADMGMGSTIVNHNIQVSHGDRLIEIDTDITSDFAAVYPSNSSCSTRIEYVLEICKTGMTRLEEKSI